ncbi:MAG: TolC family protein [Phycisphaerales bacterium JB037]
MTENRTVRRGTRALVALAGLALGASLGGCSNPLAPLESDYGRVVDRERLRSVRTLELGEGTPVPRETRRPTLEEVENRYADLERLEVGLEEARASALENNLGLKVARVDPAIANARVSEEEAAFEAVFFGSARYADTDTPTSSTLNSAKQDFRSLEAGVRIPLRTGGTAQVSLPITRNQTNNSFATLNPAWTADLEFSYSQPLLRNAGRFATTQGIRIASYDRQITEAQTTLAIIAELSSVDRAYWNLYRARRALDVRQSQYEVALAQVERAERLVRAGRAVEVEILRAESGLADRLEAIIVAENDLLNRQRELKRRMNLPGLDVATATRVDPATPPDPLRYELDPAELSELAERSRMEMLELELRLLADAANIRLRENQTQPELTLDVLYRINGLGRDLGRASEVLAENDFEDLSIGLTGEIPIGNEAARSRLRQATLTRMQRLADREARRQTIREEVYDAVDAIDSAWQRILAARQSVVVNVRAFDAEQRQFENGRSTSTDVLDAASRLADAQLAEINAIVDYQLAQIDLAQATGTLLGAARVSWEPAGLEDAPADVAGDAMDAGDE